MPKFRSKPTIIDAEQFTGPREVKKEDTPPTIRGIHWEHLGSDMCQFPYVITIQGQRVAIKPGEWIVDEGDGVHFYPIAAEKFAKKYEPV